MYHMSTSGLHKHNTQTHMCIYTMHIHTQHTHICIYSTTHEDIYNKFCSGFYSMNLRHAHLPQCFDTKIYSEVITKAELII